MTLVMNGTIEDDEVTTSGLVFRNIYKILTDLSPWISHIRIVGSAVHTPINPPIRLLLKK